MLRILPESIARIVRPFLTAAGRDAARRLGWLTLWSLGCQACGLASILLLTTALPADQFGKLIFALTMQSYLALVGMGGAYTVALRDTCRRPEQMPQIAAAYLSLTAILSSLAGFVGLLLAWWLHSDAEEFFVLCLIALGNIAVCMTLRPFYDAQHRQPQSAQLMFACEVIALATLALMCGWDVLTLPVIALLYAAKWLSISLAHAWLLPMSAVSLKNDCLRRGWQMVGESWPLMFGALLRLVPLTGGVLLMRFSGAASQVAVMGVIQQVVLAYVLLATLGNRIVEPYIAGKYGEQRDFVLKLSVFVAAFLSCLWLLMAGVGILATEVLLPSAYHGVWQGLALMLLGAVADAVGMVGRMYLIVRRAERLYLLASAVAALTFLGLAWVWVPAAPLLGIAAASCCATLIGAILTFAAIGLVVRRIGKAPLIAP